MLVSTLQWGLLPVADRRAVALIVFPAFIVQAIVGIFAIGARDSIAATLMLSFATTWLVDSRGHEVLPVGRLGAARQATHGTLAVELRDIERAPGVRRTL